MSTASRAETVTRWSVAIVGFAIIFLDRFDTALLPLLLPTLSPLWQLAPKSFGIALTITNIGAVFGFFVSGWLVSRFGLKRVLIVGCIWFGVWTLAAALILHLQSMSLLAAVRLMTGFGLGVVVPTAIGLATQHAARRHQAVIAVLVTLGLGTGAAACGFLGGSLVRAFGPNGSFLFGGILPLIIAAIGYLVLPAHVELTAQAPQAQNRYEAMVARLLERGYRGTTILLWVFSFSIFIAYYTLSNWIPSLLIGFGFGPTEAPLGLGFFSIGAVLGGLALFVLVRMVDVRPLLLIMCAISTVFIVLVGKADTASRLLLLLYLAGAGFGIVAAQIGQLTLAVLYYPAGMRTTGVGWAAAMGRCGSIIGPAVGGLLLAAGLDGQSIVLTMLVPMLLASAISAVLWSLDSQVKEEDVLTVPN